MTRGGESKRETKKMSEEERKKREVMQVRGKNGGIHDKGGSEGMH